MSKIEYTCEVPVLLLFFNRPDHAQAVLERLRSVKPSRVYVHCDGPREGVAAEAEKVAAVRALVDTIDWECAVFTLYRDRNLGLRNGVSNALDWFFGQEEMGIVLEDDCLPDISFFPYCETLLKYYHNDPKVMHIAGSNLARSSTGGHIESYFFSKFVFVWGWASWRRAWQKMSLDLNGLESFRAKKRIAEITENSMAQAYLLDKFEVTRQKKNNSWAYAWLFSILQAGGISIVPSKNLVQNTGIGEAGATHTGKKNDNAAIRADRLDFPLIHPKSKQVKPWLDQQLFYLSQKSRWRLLLWFLLKKAGLR
jgi:hypothetical protein